MTDRADRLLSDILLELRAIRRLLEQDSGQPTMAIGRPIEPQGPASLGFVSNSHGRARKTELARRAFERANLGKG